MTDWQRPSWLIEAQALATTPTLATPTLATTPTLAPPLTPTPTTPSQAPPVRPSPSPRLRPKRVLKKHRTPSKSWCFREEAVPIVSEAGLKIGWQCRGCGAPFPLTAPQVKKPAPPTRKKKRRAAAPRVKAPTPT